MHKRIFWFIVVLAAIAMTAFAQPTSTPPFPAPPPMPAPPGNTGASMNCASDKLFVADFNKGIWQFCTGQDGKPMGFLMAAAQNVSQLYSQGDGTLTAYGNDGVIRQFSVIYGQPYYQYRGDWPAQQGGRLTAIQGNAISVVFPWNYRAGQLYLYGSGEFSYSARPQADPYYILAVRNATGLYGVNSNGELYHHELFFGGISRQPALVMKGVATIATPSADSPLLYVGLQAQFDFTVPSTNGFKVIQPGSIVKVRYDRWASSPYSTEVVLTGVFPATMWPSNTIAVTDTSVYFIEQHPTAGSRLVGYSNKSGTSGITLMLDKNSGFFRNDQGDNVDPSFSAIAIPPSH